VVINLRIDAETAHALYRAVAEALRAQEVLHAKQLARQRMLDGGDANRKGGG
jgi:hypothetical protein